MEEEINLLSVQRLFWILLLFFVRLVIVFSRHQSLKKYRDINSNLELRRSLS